MLLIVMLLVRCALIGYSTSAPTTKCPPNASINKLLASTPALIISMYYYILSYYMQYSLLSFPKKFETKISFLFSASVLLLTTYFLSYSTYSVCADDDRDESVSVHCHHIAPLSVNCHLIATYCSNERHRCRTHCRHYWLLRAQEHGVCGGRRQGSGQRWYSY